MFPVFGMSRHTTNRDTMRKFKNYGRNCPSFSINYEKKKKKNYSPIMTKLISMRYVHASNIF